MMVKRRAVLAALAVSFLGTVRCDAEQSPDVTLKDAKAMVISAPMPDYPLLAREARYTGSGVFILNLQRSSGVVQSITIGRSTGHQILDWAAMAAFIRWRFKPNTAKKVKIPVTFTMTGWRY
jgi:TonB family protein